MLSKNSWFTLNKRWSHGFCQCRVVLYKRHIFDVFVENRPFSKKGSETWTVHSTFVFNQSCQWRKSLRNWLSQHLQLCWLRRCQKFERLASSVILHNAAKSSGARTSSGVSKSFSSRMHIGDPEAPIVPQRSSRFSVGVNPGGFAPGPPQFFCIQTL